MNALTRDGLLSPTCCNLLRSVNNALTMMFFASTSIPGRMRILMFATATRSWSRERCERDVAYGARTIEIKLKQSVIKQ